MAKTTKCMNVQVKNGKREDGSSRLFDYDVYKDGYGLCDGEKLQCVCHMMDIKDNTEWIKEIVVLIKGNKIINLDDHVQVTLATLNKGHYTKLSGYGNEPRLRLAASTK